MKRYAPIMVGLAALAAGCSVPSDNPDLVVIATTDVHGNFYPYDFIGGGDGPGSMARVATYVDSLRRIYGDDHVLLLDNGDILQGQPPAYYYNYVDTLAPHLSSEVYRWMGYDAATIGNHDIEAGHDVYDRWSRECSPMPVLGANVRETASGKPYFQPYTIIERGGLRVAVLGMITPAIPAWLPRNLWEGMEFDDMVSAAAHWVEEIRTRENPDLVIGLFHSGADSTRTAAGYQENASLQVARNVPGIDLVLFGHDHRRHESVVRGNSGKEVVCLNPANNARAVARADIRLTPGGLEVKGTLVSVDSMRPSEEYMRLFAPQMEAVRAFVADTVGYSTGEFDQVDAFFGPSTFIDLIHRLQLQISGADISMAAPLGMKGGISRGPLTMADMFTLYKYENLLYVMELTGQEIKDYLEKSYAGWVNHMSGPDDHLLLLDANAADDGRPGLATPYYNYDSAAGIDYTVDVSRPAGSRVAISGMSNGEPFELDRVYRVAVNSYRGNGGGDLLTLGAGIAPDDLARRVVWATDRDMRHYLTDAIRRAGSISPEVASNWRFVPAGWAEAGAQRDRKMLAGD